MVMFTLVELATAGAAILAAMAEVLHQRRCRRLARLAFGPDQKPAPWARLAPALRVAAIAALTWGLATLMVLPPKAHVAETIPDKRRRHVLIVLDVSPSMRLKDAGPNADQTRRKRAADVMESFFQRVPIEIYLISVVACYNVAKPVVVDTKDMDVIRNIFGDLPLQYAFPAGKTDLFSGLAEAARIAQPWQPRSTLLLLVSDGDTVSTTGMPRMPASIADVLVVGVGDPRLRLLHRRQDVATGCRHAPPDCGSLGRHVSRRQPEAPWLGAAGSVERDSPEECLRTPHSA